MVRPSVRILVFPPSQELSLLFVLFAERLPLYHFRPKIKKKVHTKKCFLKMFGVILVVGIYRTMKKYSNICFYSSDLRNFQKYNCNKKKRLRRNETIPNKVRKFGPTKKKWCTLGHEGSKNMASRISLGLLLSFRVFFFGTIRGHSERGKTFCRSVIQTTPIRIGLTFAGV